MPGIMNHATIRRALLWVWLLLLPAIALAQTQLGSAAAMQAKHDAVNGQLEQNLFGRPLALESTEASGQLSGNIFAVVSYPFDQVSSALGTPAGWCEVLMLHLNTKHCAVRETGGTKTVAVAVGRKFDQPLSDAQKVDFVWQPATVSSDYFSARLSADKGPLSTRDYRIELDGACLASVTKKHPSWRHHYDITIAADEDEGLLLAIAIAIDHWDGDYEP